MIVNCPSKLMEGSPFYMLRARVFCQIAARVGGCRHD